MPQSAQAEIGLIASFLLDPHFVAGLCEERNCLPDWFYVPANASIYEALIGMRAMKKPIDFITLTETLRELGMLDECGGASRITELFTLLPTAANAAYYLDTLAERYSLRRLIQVCTEFVKRAYDETENAGQLVDEAQTEILRLTRPDSGGMESVKHIKEGVVHAIANIDQTYHSRGGVVGLRTGFHQLDRMTGGLRNGQLVIVAGRPSMGKSAFAWNIGEFVSIDRGQPVLGFSLEMNLMELASRMVCGRARVNLQRVRDGYLSKHQIDQTLPAAATAVAAAPIYIDETPGLSIQELRARARRFLKKFPQTACIIVDYLQLMKSSTRRGQENRALEIAEISGGLKNLAKELNIPIIAGAQLNRDNDGPNQKPKLSNLRESGSIEQDADVVLLLHRKHYYTKADEDKGKASADLGKQRNGPTGEIQLVFVDELGRFENPEGQTLYSNDPTKRQGHEEDEE